MAGRSETPAAKTPLASKYHRDPEHLRKRMSRIEGQVRGIARMIEDDRYCIDVLQQVSAAQAALREVGLILLEGHLLGCVADAVQGGRGDASIEELMDAVRRFSR